VFYKETRREVRKKETGKKEMERFLFARSTAVFNASQVEGWDQDVPMIENSVEIVEQAESFVAATGADIRHGGGKAYYNMMQDYIQIPSRELFTGTATSTPTESYYSTQLHELTHWTSHKDRCDRQLSKRFGKEAYAMEELVAELGAAFLCSDLRITNTPRPDHAGYLAGWLSVLKSDKRAIFTASSKASQAKNFLTSLQSSS
jgi:antirestriction protein ArdC